MTRRALLVGSLPFDDEASAMARAIELVGDRLLALPDGEIGERSDQYPSGDRSQWVAGLAGRLARETTLLRIERCEASICRRVQAWWPDSSTNSRRRRASGGCLALSSRRGEARWTSHAPADSGNEAPGPLRS